MHTHHLHAASQYSLPGMCHSRFAGVQSFTHRNELFQFDADVKKVNLGLCCQVGVLTRHILDDGRGFARSKVFKHGHEEATGRTSSIGQHNLCVSTLLLPCWLPPVTAEPRAAASVASIWTEDNICAAYQCIDYARAPCHAVQTQPACCNNYCVVTFWKPWLSRL